MRERLRPDYAPEGAERPGDFPFTRGVSADPKPWIMGQYAGFGTAAESNRRFRSLLDAGATGFSVALDLPTQMGIDSDDPRAAGEVGRVGVAIDSLADIEMLMEGIPLEAITQVRTTANSIGYVWAAMFIALAERRGVDPVDVRDVHPERRAQGVHRARHPDLPARGVAPARGRHHRAHRAPGAHLGAAGDVAATTSGSQAPTPSRRSPSRSQRSGLPRRVRSVGG